VEVEERNIESGRMFLDEREIRRFDWCGHEDEGVRCQDFVFGKEGLDWLRQLLASLRLRPQQSD
jgi:hypothetical protein